MQWWDAADDLWFALRLRLAALHHLAAPASRTLVAFAGLLLTV